MIDNLFYYYLLVFIYLKNIVTIIYYCIFNFSEHNISEFFFTIIKCISQQKKIRI